MLTNAKKIAEDSCVGIGIIFKGKAPKETVNPAKLSNISYRDEAKVLPRGYKGLRWDYDRHFDFQGHEIYANKIKPVFQDLIDEILNSKTRMEACN